MSARNIPPHPARLAGSGSAPSRAYQRSLSFNWVVDASHVASITHVAIIWAASGVPLVHVSVLWQAGVHFRGPIAGPFVWALAAFRTGVLCIAERFLGRGEYGGEFLPRRNTPASSIAEFETGCVFLCLGKRFASRLITVLLPEQPGLRVLYIIDMVDKASAVPTAGGRGRRCLLVGIADCR